MLKMSDDEEWRPTLSEVTNLLEQLGHSPPENSLLESPESSISSQKFLTDSDYEDTSFLSSISEESFNRKEALEKLAEFKEAEEEIRVRNFQLTECLIDFFERKHMVYAMSEERVESEEDVENYYKALKRLKKSKEKLESFRENSSGELKEIRKEIEKKKEKVEELVAEILENQKKIQKNHEEEKGRGRKIFELINRQLDKIKIISEYRLAYIKLRNDLFSLHESLNSIIRENPNLTKADYERLEAEKFFYIQQLDLKDRQLKLLGKKKKTLEIKISKVKSITREIKGKIRKAELLGTELSEEILELELRKRSLREKFVGRKIVRNKMNDKVFVKNNEDLKEYQEIVNREHEKWIKKISRQLKQLKTLRQRMSAVKTYFILHEKNK